jgi:hypothetical protein
MKPMPVSQRVLHEKYGLGTITEADRYYTTIEFDDFGKKKFVTRIVKLETSDEPAPQRRRSRKIRPS